MRSGELLGLTWHAVDFDRGAVSVVALHVKRPHLIPVCDSYVLRLMGIPGDSAASAVALIEHLRSLRSVLRPVLVDLQRELRHQKRMFAKLAPAEQSVSERTIEQYRNFMNERRAAMGKSAEAEQRVGDQTKQLLAVHRKQFSCIRMALADALPRCPRRSDDTCCRAVSERLS